MNGGSTNGSKNDGLSRRGMLGLLAMAAAATGVLLPAPADAGGGDGSAEPIVVGHYGSTTGKEATFGISTDNGIKLAFEEINAAGGINGRPLKLITYDTKGEAQ